MHICRGEGAEGDGEVDGICEIFDCVACTCFGSRCVAGNDQESSSRIPTSVQLTTTFRVHAESSNTHVLSTLHSDDSIPIQATVIDVVDGNSSPSLFSTGVVVNAVHPIVATVVE